jgi:excisionase family DNA binding protein
VEIAKRLYSTDAFCAAFSVGKTKLYQMLREGEIVASKIGDKTVIPHEEAERWRSSLPKYSDAKCAGGPGRPSSQAA